MTDTATMLGAVAQLIRTKNAGPFWVTIDVFFKDAADYTRAVAAQVLTEPTIADIYRVDPATVRLFHLPNINVIKASLPRPAVQGSFADRDMHAGQQHVPLLQLPTPAVPGTLPPSVAQ
jgi:hypothetical protein